MAGVYPEFEALVVVDAGGSKDRLNAEVWRHAGLADERGLALVVEVYARSVLASRRLTEWWKSGNTLMQDTLAGIYLLRIDLQTFGPEAVIKLTPYAVVGAPLFVGWNPFGQVCSRSQFDELTPESMALPLSAFVEDVLAGRPHSLNPVPSLGSAERTREAAALRRVGQAFAQAAARRVVAKGAGDGGVNVAEGPASTRGETPPSEAPPSANASEQETRQPVPSEAQLSEGATDVVAAAVPDAASADLDASVPADFDAIVSPLDQLLASARSKFGALEDRVGAPLRLQVDDLRAIDQWQASLGDTERLTFAREFGAVLAVYVGDTIIRRVRADWVWDGNGPSGAAKLALVGEVLGQERRTQPLEWVIETLSDEARSLYGQALAWCRIV
jgi:hypothetical protein